MFAGMPIYWILEYYNGVIDRWDSLTQSQRRFARVGMVCAREELASRGITKVYEDEDGYIALG